MFFLILVAEIGCSLLGVYYFDTKFIIYDGFFTFDIEKFLLLIMFPLFGKF